MSLKQNDEWLVAAYENFEGALDEGNYSLAQDIIADTKDKGFTSSAAMMTEVLKHLPINQFAIKSPYGKEY